MFKLIHLTVQKQISEINYFFIPYLFIEVLGLLYKTKLFTNHDNLHNHAVTLTTNIVKQEYVCNINNYSVKNSEFDCARFNIIQSVNVS